MIQRIIRCVGARILGSFHLNPLVASRMENKLLTWPQKPGTSAPPPPLPPPAALDFVQSLSCSHSSNSSTLFRHPPLCSSSCFSSSLCLTQIHRLPMVPRLPLSSGSDPSHLVHRSYLPCASFAFSPPRVLLDGWDTQESTDVTSSGLEGESVPGSAG